MGEPSWVAQKGKKIKLSDFRDGTHSIVCDASLVDKQNLNSVYIVHNEYLFVPLVNLSQFTYDSISKLVALLQKTLHSYCNKINRTISTYDTAVIHPNH